MGVELGAHGRVRRVVAKLKEVLVRAKSELVVAAGDGGWGGEVDGLEVRGEGGDAAEHTACVAWAGAMRGVSPCFRQQRKWEV